MPHFRGIGRQGRCNTGGHTPTFDELMGEVGGCLTAISRRLPSLPSRSETSDARAGLPDDTEITFGIALIDSPLRWYRLERRGARLHVELIEDIDFDLTYIGPAQ